MLSFVVQMYEQSHLNRIATDEWPWRYPRSPKMTSFDRPSAIFCHCCILTTSLSCNVSEMLPPVLNIIIKNKNNFVSLVYLLMTVPIDFSYLFSYFSVIFKPPRDNMYRGFKKIIIILQSVVVIPDIIIFIVIIFVLIIITVSYTHLTLPTIYSV